MLFRSTLFSTTDSNYYDIKPQDAKRKSKHDLLVGFGVDLITVDLVDNNWENATVNLLEKMEQNIQARR